MHLNMRTVAVSFLTSGLLALSSSMAIAQTVNNIDNTTPGMSGHGSGCANHAGGCNATQESSTFGAYQPAVQPSAGSTTGTSTTNPAPDESAPINGCMDAADATPGHCISGGTNK